MVMTLAALQRFSNHENQQEADIPEIRLVLRSAILAPGESSDATILLTDYSELSVRSPGRREFPRSRPARHQSTSAPFGCGAQIGCMRGKITRMEIRRRLGLL
jgi:hypothetical protein